MTNAIKQRYFDKVYANAKNVLCKCGCGNTIKNKDKFGRNVNFVNGHNGRKYDDPKQYKREWNHRNRKQMHDYRKLRLSKIKLELIFARGNKCVDCGYACNGTNGRVFDFHHTVPKNKKFAINHVSIDRFSRKKIDEELKKCILLCAICHRLRH